MQAMTEKARAITVTAPTHPLTILAGYDRGLITSDAAIAELRTAYRAYRDGGDAAGMELTTEVAIEVKERAED